VALKTPTLSLYIKVNVHIFVTRKNNLLTDEVES
jgi:hypothetical protein